MIGIKGMVLTTLACLSQASNGQAIQYFDKTNTTVVVSIISQSSDVELEKEQLQNWTARNEDLTIAYSWQDRNSMKADIHKHLGLLNGPEILGWYAGGEVTRSFIKQGMIADLHEVFEEYGLYDVIPEAMLKGVSDENGHPHAIPTDMYHWGLYYNKELFTNLDIKVPTTWEEFRSACKELLNANILPISIGTMWRWTAAGWFDYLNMRINGPEFHINLTAGNVPYNDHRVRDVFIQWKELLDLGYFGNDNIRKENTWEKMKTDIRNKTAGFALMGDFLRWGLPAEELAVIDFIQFPVINPGVPIGEDAPTDGFVMSANAQNKEGAKRLISFFASELFQRTRLAHVAIPSNKHVVSDISDPITLRGAQMIADADYVVQFYDRDTNPEMTNKGLDGMMKFLADPESIDPILDELETFRQEIYLGVAAEVQMTTPGGTFDAAITVNMTTLTEGAEIHFTLDGSVPDENSELYEGPVSIEFHGRHTLRAVATKEGLKNSKITQEVYNIVIFHEQMEAIGGLTKAGLALGVVAMLYTAALLVIVILKRNEPVFKATSSLFVIIMLVGSLISISSTFSMSIEVDETLSNIDTVSSMCMYTVGAISLGWGLTFGALLFKTWRIMKIFGNKSLKAVRITNKQVLGGVVLVTSIELLIVILWAIVSPLRVEKVKLGDFVFAMECKTEQPFWVYATIFTKTMELLVALVFCILTRNVVSAFNESKQIGFAIYNLAFIGAASLALSSAMSQKNIAYIVQVVGIVMTNCVTTSSIVIPKIYIMYAHPELNSQKAWFSSSSKTGGGNTSVAPTTNSTAAGFK